MANTKIPVELSSTPGIVDNSNATAITIDSSENVGIGVTPSTIWSSSYDALQIGIGGSISAHSSAGDALKIGSNFVYEGTAPNYYDKYLTTSTAHKYELDVDGHKWFYAASGTAGNAISWSEAMRIDSSGRLLVGATSPFSADSVTIDQGGFLAIRNTSGSGMEVRRDSTDGSLIDFQKDGSPVGSIGGGTTFLTIGSGTGNVYFQNGVMAPTASSGGASSNGVIDLGTSSSKFKDLYLSGAAYSGGSFSAGTTGNSTFFAEGSQHIFRRGSAGSYAEFGRFDSSGRLLVGATSTTAPAGTIFPLGYRGRAGTGGTETNNFNIAWTGSAANLWIDTSNQGAITVSSDYRIKRNIETQTADALSRVKKIRPVTYQPANYGEIFKESDEIKEGFIAHELAEIIPSAVQGEKDDPSQIQSLKVDALCSVLTKAIQEQQAQIEALQSEINELKNS